MNDFYKKINEIVNLVIKQIEAISSWSVIFSVLCAVGLAVLFAFIWIPQALLDIGSVAFFTITFVLLSYTLYKRTDSVYAMRFLDAVLDIFFSESANKFNSNLEPARKEKFADNLQTFLLYLCIGGSLISLAILIITNRPLSIQNTYRPIIPIAASTPSPIVSGTQLITIPSPVINGTQSITTFLPIVSGARLITPSLPVVSGAQPATTTNLIFASPLNLLSSPAIAINSSLPFTTNLKFNWDIDSSIPITLVTSPHMMILQEYQDLIDVVTPRVVIADVVFQKSPTFVDREYVVLVNHGDDLDISRWAIVDGSHHKYIFPAIHLDASSAIFLYTGHGENSRNHFYWSNDSSIWQEEPEITLYDTNNAVIDKWSKTGFINSISPEGDLDK